jgi:prepilin-type N-terminal cleavage/methylation domain-containing protein
MSTMRMHLRKARRRDGVRSRLRRRLNRDGGFTLIELVVTMGVVATALSMLAGVMTSGLSATGYARERQSGAQLANQTLEQIRSLASTTMKAGLKNTDLSGDPAITTCGSASCYGGEQIATHLTGAVPDVAPLFPHVSTSTIGNVAYTIRSYVTLYQNVATTDARRVTVTVSWTSNLKGLSNRTISAQTVMFAQSGSTSCQSIGTHPFPGPCDPSFTAAATQTPASASITGTIGGVALDHATLWSGRAVSDAAVEQTWHVQGVSQAAGATLQLAGGSEQDIGREQVASKADNDPDPALSNFDTQTLSPASSGSAQATMGSNSLTVSTVGTDVGATTSTTSACTTGGCTTPSTPSPRTCPNLTGYTNETDLLPCGGSSERTAATATAQANLGSLGTANLATLGGVSSPVTTTIDRKTSAGGTSCPTIPASPVGDGCMRAAAIRPAMTLTAGALPSTFTLSGFTSYLQMSGLSDSVAAEAGIGTNAPTATQTSGNVTVFCSAPIAGNLLCPTGTPLNSYTTKTFAQITVATALPPLSITSGATTVTIGATVTPGTTTATSVGSPRTSATATSTPPTVTVTYQVVTAGTSVVNTTIVLDPGQLSATATYAPGLT